MSWQTASFWVKWRSRFSGFTMEITLPQRLQRYVNGSFQRTVLLQKRIRQIVRGDAPLFDAELEHLDNPIEIALTEIERGLVELKAEEVEVKPTLD
ncbi:MAG: DNA-directed RNA polymerase subunit omega [Planctomycetota bacterium]|nr:DNA-directed RNA polymerase subunit omega [Planctomycetota bacterium]